MRLVHLFFSHGAAPADSRPPWNPKQPCNDKWLDHQSEGTHYLIRRMLEEKIIDDVLFIIESNRGPGRIDFKDGIKGYVVPEISYVNDFMRDDDVIWIRGGFRSWHNFIVDNHIDKWKLLYAANTGRERWPWWDVVFDDLKPINQKPYMDQHMRAFLHWEKPINPTVFYPISPMIREYDVCIGASKVHDKKGQWRTINALLAYQQKYGKQLKCIFPGGGGHGKHTNDAMNMIKVLDVETPGFVSRKELNTIYNQSKLFVHLGTGGQNDRGPLEALQCGSSVLIGYPRRHGTIVRFLGKIARDMDDPMKTAVDIHNALGLCNGVTRMNTAATFEKHSGAENYALPLMKRLFGFFREHPKTDKEALMDFVTSERQGG